MKRVVDHNAIGTTSTGPNQFMSTPNQFVQAPQQNFIQSPNNPTYNPTINNAVPTSYGVAPMAPQSFQNVSVGPNVYSEAPSAQMNPTFAGGINSNVPGFQQPFAMFQQPIVQDMAIQYGQKLADQGKQLMENQFEKYVPVTRLKYYFAVDNKYVINKLRLLFFPFTHTVKCTVYILMNS